MLFGKHGVKINMAILCLHGFLGNPCDFDFLKNDFDIITPNLSKYVHLSFDELCDKMRTLFNPNRDIILGYSFGARLGARLFHELNMNTQLISFAGHLGLQKKDLNERVKIEEKFKSQLRDLSQQDFLQYWNNLNLFKYDQKLEHANFEQAILYFENYALSMQPRLTEKLLPKKDHISFFFGERDEKYCDYAKDDLNKYQVHFIENCGHRLLQSKDKINQLLKEVIA